jgi:hypothetical protein
LLIYRAEKAKFGNEMLIHVQNRWALLAIFFFFAFSTHMAHASLDKLYQASVKVEEGKTENELIAEAFSQVLIKISGQSDVSSSTAYESMLTKAKGAISQFRYEQRAVPALTGSVSNEPQKDAKEEQKEKWFWVSFNPSIINELLRKAKLPIWGKNRPETLIWFTQEVKGQRFLQSQHEVPELYQAFEQQADDRGISLIFPFLDLQDQASISATDIWGNFNDAILLASRRYHAQATVTVRLFKEKSGLYVSQWNLLMLGNVQSWELRGEDKSHLLKTGIDELADRLAQQFAPLPTEENGSALLIGVNNVNGFKAYQELDDYLRNLATVKSVVLVQMKKDRLIYKVRYLNDKNAFIQEIRLGEYLSSVENTRDTDTVEPQNREYQAVILDDLDNKELTQREKALMAVENTSTELKTQAPANAQNQTANTQSGQPDQSTQIIVQPVRPVLMPDLEYWLAR